MPEELLTPTPQAAVADPSAYLTRLAGATLALALREANLPAASTEAIEAQFAGKVPTTDEIDAAIVFAACVDLPTVVLDHGPRSPARRRARQWHADQPGRGAGHRQLDVRRTWCGAASALAAPTVGDLRRALRRLRMARRLQPGAGAVRLGHDHHARRSGCERAQQGGCHHLGEPRGSIAGFQPLVTVQPHDGSTHDMAWIEFGGISNLPVVAQGAAYPELSVADGKEADAFVKYGGYVGITEEMLRKASWPRFGHPQGARHRGGAHQVGGAGQHLHASQRHGPTLDNDSTVLFHTNHGGNVQTTALPRRPGRRRGWSATR